MSSFISAMPGPILSQSCATTGAQWPAFRLFRWHPGAGRGSHRTRAAWFSFTGISDFQKRRVRARGRGGLSLGEIMVENYCPYLAPTPFRGKRCEPAHTRLVAESIAAMLTRNLNGRGIFPAQRSYVSAALALISLGTSCTVIAVIR